jgi:hypothetical protein
MRLTLLLLLLPATLQFSVLLSICIPLFGVLLHAIQPLLLLLLPLLLLQGLPVVEGLLHSLVCLCPALCVPSCSSGLQQACAHVRQPAGAIIHICMDLFSSGCSLCWSSVGNIEEVHTQVLELSR